MRYQQIELQAKGKAFVLRGMEFRRDGTIRSNIGPRTLTATIRIGSGSGTAFTTTYGNNWVGTPTTVVNAQTFNLPALPRPTAPPAPFLIKFPFSSVAAHSGQNELLWEMVVTANGNQSYICDAHSTGSARGRFRSLGLGCTTSGSSRFTLAHSFRASTAVTELLYGASRAPANLPVIALIGAVNPDLQLPGVCAKLYALPLATIALGTSTASGSVANQWFGMGPWNPAWSGGKLYSQAFAPDPTQAAGFSLSSGIELGHKLGLDVHGGHGLTYRNVAAVASLPGFSEFNIGHSIVSRAIFVGMREAVREMKRLINLHDGA